MWPPSIRRSCCNIWRCIRCIKMDIHMAEGNSRCEIVDKSPEKTLKDTKRALKKTPVEECTREELIARVTQLEAHVLQLKNIIAKSEEKPASGTKKQRPFDFSRYNFRHIALKILYLGWDYNGFTVQEDTDKTIEAALFDALIKSKLIEKRETSNYHRCGRTDKGVSAFSQVISIDVRSNLSEGLGMKARGNEQITPKQGEKREELPYASLLNKLLPREIRVLAWAPVHEDFSARFSCKQRTYKYFFPHGDLNLELMQISGKKLEGVHDFRNFCKMDVSHGVVTFRREILLVDVKECDERDIPAYRMCELTVVGNAFLWHQIRCIVSVLFLVAKGVEPPEIIEELLDVEKHPKKPQYTMASELPLVLFDCQFENVDWIYNEEAHRYNVKRLQELWGKAAIKATMIRKMLTELEHVPELGAEGVTGGSFLDWMAMGWKGKTYKRLLDRQTCESLEDKMESVAKKKKLAVGKTEPS